MTIKKYARALIKKDLQLIMRDSFLLFMTFFIVIISFVMRFGLPWFNTYLCAQKILPCALMPQPLSAFYPLLVSFFACFEGALIAGTVFGFAFLDEKDDNTIKAMLVSPVPFYQQILFRVGLPMLLSAIIVIAQVLFIGLAVISLWKLIFIALGSSLVAPIAALFYATFAQNKVQGLAYAKFVGVAGWVIIIGWFIPLPWQWLFGLFPPFLMSKAYWMAYEGNFFWWMALIFGVLLQIVLLGWLIKKFKKAVYQ